jgi:uronate dehydrogenase
MKRIAITGAAGLVGTGLRRQLVDSGYAVLSVDLKPIPDAADKESTAVVHITDQAALTQHLKGTEAIVHLAACTTDAPWPDQVRLSVEGTISVFEAARTAGVRRVVYASSHHVVGLHPRAPQGPLIGDTAILRPDSRYAVGKAFGESAAALYAYKYGFSVLCIRIGNVNTRPIDRRRLGSWISLRDLRVRDRLRHLGCNWAALRQLFSLQAGVPAAGHLRRMGRACRRRRPGAARRVARESLAG